MRLTVSVYKLTEKSSIYYLTCAIFTHKVNKPVTICTLKRDPVCHVTRTRRQPAIDPSSGNSLTQAGKTFSIIHRPSSLARGCSTLSNSLSLSLYTSSLAVSMNKKTRWKAQSDPLPHLSEFTSRFFTKLSCSLAHVQQSSSGAFGSES